MLDRVERLRVVMRAQGVDAVVVSSPDNAIYIAGFTVRSHFRHRSRRTFVLLPLEGEAVFVTVTVEELLAKSVSPWITDVRAYNEFTQKAVDLIADALEEKGLASGRIAIESDHMPGDDYLRLKERLGQAELTAAAPLLAESRRIKTPDEMALLKKLAHRASMAHGEAYAQLRSGMTEKDLAVLLTEAVSELDTVSPIVGSGERGSFANAPPTDRPLQSGDVVRVDLVGAKDYYNVDIARTFVVGKATQEQKDIWATMQEAYKRVQAELRAGATTGALHRLYLDTLKKGNLDPSLEFLGHGIGLTVHEGPYMNSYVDTPLEAGMVICIEPMYLVPGRMGFHIEDEFLITEDGCEVLSPGTPNEELLEVDLS